MVPPFGKLLTTITYTVNSVSTNSLTVDLTPDLNGSVNVLDERFATDDRSVTLVHYYITNGVVPAKSTVKKTRCMRPPIEPSMERRPRECR